MDENIEFSGYRKYEWSFIPVTGPNVTTKKFVCSTMIFQNQGTSTVMLDNTWRILPGQAMVFPGYPGEVNVHTYEISFTNTGGPSNINQLVIATKNYSDDGGHGRRGI